LCILLFFVNSSRSGIPEPELSGNVFSRLISCTILITKVWITNPIRLVFKTDTSSKDVWVDRSPNCRFYISQFRRMQISFNCKACNIWYDRMKWNSLTPNANFMRFYNLGNSVYIHNFILMNSFPRSLFIIVLPSWVSHIWLCVPVFNLHETSTLSEISLMLLSFGLFVPYLSI
jgi:hypothetical protein